MAVTSLSLMAEGYQVNTLSARQGGMAHTGTALKLGAESMIFNPAGMASMDKTIDFSASISPIFATGKVTMPSGETYSTENQASTPISAVLGFSIYDNLKGGIAFYTPYGSNINWTQNWPGAALNQSCKLAAYTVQPTLSWQIIPRLSVGAGLMVTWGNVDLNKGLISPSQQTGNITPASINLTGTASVAFGVNVGALYDVTDKWTIGASYKSKMAMKVKSGSANVSYAVDGPLKEQLSQKLDYIDKTNFSAEMPCVSILNLGVSYKPISKLTLAFDAQLSFWKEYKSLDIDFQLPTEPVDLNAIYDQHLPKNYHNSWAFRLGAQYALTSRLDIRAGFIADLTPVDENFYNPETPGMTKLEPTVGLSFRPVENFSIDMSFVYVAGLGKDNAKCEYKDLLTGTSPVFTANYKVHAFVPSIGLSYSF